jgi:signal transduction histidine kinase
MLTDGSLGQAPDSFVRPLHTVQAKTGELNRMVEALLHASQIDANGTPLQGNVINLRTVVDDAVTRARPRADLLHADISTKVARDAVLVAADERQLGRVLDNLINNSLSYTTPPARLFIGLSTDSEHAVVRVEDNGVGIADDQREQVFDSFYRGTGPAVAKVPGVGLGLYISRQLAENFGGTLVVESSTLGVGTVFALALPLAGPASPGWGT